MTKALVRRPAPGALRLGRSLASASPGELVIITPRGEVYQPAPRAAVLAASAVLLTALTLGFGLPGLVSGAFAMTMFSGLRMLLPDLRRLRRALAAHARFDHAEALAVLDQTAIAGLPRRWRPAARYLRVRVLTRLGRLVDAEHLLKELIAAAAAPNASAPLHRNRWLFAIQLADVLAAQGKVAEALAAREHLAGAPPGSYFQFARLVIDIQIVLAGGPPRLLDEVELFEPARMILRSNLLGEHAYLLAFAFERQGDLEMARHLFAEAPSRAPDGAWTAAMPLLARWVQAAAVRLGDMVLAAGV